MEQLLHYVWKHKILPLHELATTDGLAVEVIDPGLPNPHAGPDFFNAKIKIDGTMWVGNIEIHSASTDWKRHGHHHDRAYDSVILHVAGKIDDLICRTTGEPIPQMRLECPPHVQRNYQELKRSDKLPPCHTILSALPPLKIHGWLAALHVERLEQKNQLIAERLRRHNQHWEDVCFVTLARNFGFGLNGDSFEAWANRLSLRAADKHRDNLMQVEAIFFGQAGLLNEEIMGDTYYDDLRHEYRYLQRKFGLQETDPTTWLLLRTRPHNFPHTRIAQLAYLYHRAHALFSQLMEAETVTELAQILDLRTSSYWDSHFLFGKRSTIQEKKLTSNTLHLILINTIVPLLYAYGKYKGSELYFERATRHMESLPAEKNSIVGRWKEVGLPAQTAADSQALIQLHNAYCKSKKCLHCRFGYEYLRKKIE